MPLNEKVNSILENTVSVLKVHQEELSELNLTGCDDPDDISNAGIQSLIDMMQKWVNEINNLPPISEL